ncbi:putative major facilitator superfamily protein [Lyophyllum shimeji]|uniref:Major facilitator superfamily protein n=1 Tax=Lyophyllum shimeji TaxID=47721 RepID=A0A9P3PPT0_LYOSH|nr:putative major facilitator superfamily protein [Lyophyllum shimeji]
MKSTGPSDHPSQNCHTPDHIPLEDMSVVPETSSNHAQEDQALLPGRGRRKPRRSAPRAFLPTLTKCKPNPYWLLPVVLVASMSRGVTMSPRIQVYKAIACRTLNAEGETHGFNFDSFASAAIDCSGPEVQARAARIQASVTTLMNALSAITTGYWSRLGDVRGRKIVLALFLLGAMAMESIYLLVMGPESIFGRHAEKLILVGPIMEGLIGGLSAFNGVVHAYTSDCTPHGSRSKIFSTIQGIVFVGLAVGPWVSGFVLPESRTLEVSDAFSLSIGLLATTLFYLVVICPESRQPMEHEEEIFNRQPPLFERSPVLAIRQYTRSMISALIIPVTMFAPRPRPGRSRRNYNLTLLGAALFLYIISTAVYSSKYMYAQHVYSWTAAQLGYYMSLLWVSRAFNLLVFLPIVISYLKPKTPQTEGAPPDAKHLAAEMKFDKRLAQASLAVDCIADTLVALAPTSSQITFIAVSCLSSFTSGGNPALHSLGAVCLHACGYGSEVGALFGGIAVLSAVAHIISPYIFAVTYAGTVAYFPKAIFVLAAGILACVVTLLSGINTRPADIVVPEPLTVDGEEEEEVTDLMHTTGSSVAR